MIPITLPAYTQAARTVTVTTMNNYVQMGSHKGTQLTPRSRNKSTLLHTIYFSRGKWQLNTTQERQLGTLPQSLCYTLKGYASAVGHKAWNTVLSRKRAGAVAALMHARHCHILHSQGYGELHARPYAKARKVTVEGMPCQN